VGKKTPFYDLHLEAHAKMVDFAGWEMPLHYGSQIKEHHQVRQAVGFFDVSHMGIVDLHGADATSYLRYLLANNVDKITEGKALYTCMLNEAGGVLDDLIVYKIAQDQYRIVVNAGTREKDLAWMKKQMKSFEILPILREDLVMLAIQGPLAQDKIQLLFPEKKEQCLQLKPFTFIILDEWFIARTGYTGEDGYEIIFKASDAERFWQACLKAEIMPCGLGARDTLRLEAGLNLYGSDMNETVTPFESHLGWTVSLQPQERSFIGREALEKQMQSVQGNAKKAVIEKDLERLRVRLASTEGGPSVYAINVESISRKLDQAKNHQLVHVVRVLPPESQGEPILSSQ